MTGTAAAIVTMSWNVWSVVVVVVVETMMIVESTRSVVKESRIRWSVVTQQTGLGPSRKLRVQGLMVKMTVRIVLA